MMMRQNSFLKGFLNSLLLSSPRKQDGGNCFEDQNEILEKSSRLCVARLHGRFLLRGDLAPPRCLPNARDAGSYRQDDGSFIAIDRFDLLQKLIRGAEESGDR